MKTPYSHFKDSTPFDVMTLPMKGKRKSHGHKETHGKQKNKKILKDREKEHPRFNHEFEHLEGDTIIDKNYKSDVITFAERVSKLIIVLETPEYKAKDTETF